MDYMVEYVNIIDEDKKLEKCLKFLDEFCLIDKKSYPMQSLEVNIFLKESGEKIAGIVGFCYNHKTECSVRGKRNSFHIKSIDVVDSYARRRIGTYLMKQAIDFVEENRIKYMSVHPCAGRDIISQEDLENFYKSFSFRYLIVHKEIEFKIIVD